MSFRETIIVGVAGGSGSGKTTIVKAIEKQIIEQGVEVAIE